MKTTTFSVLLSAVLAAAAGSASAQSLLDVADATLDAVRETRAQNAAPDDVRAIFAKAKAAAANDDKLDLCGFYTGMSAADARKLAGYHSLKDGEWSTEGDPVYKIELTLKGLRRVTNGGNTFDELAQAVANRVGSLKKNWETKEYGLKTIDGIVVTMSDPGGFCMVDTEMKKRVDEAKAAEAARIAREKAEIAQRAREEREAAERRRKEEARLGAIAWRSESKRISLPGSVSLDLQSVPGELWFGKYEVTQAQWESVMGSKCDIPSFDVAKCAGPEKPACHVSWNDCQMFLLRLNALASVKESGLTFRLPTVEEWEMACRAGAAGDFCRLSTGVEIDGDSLGRVAWTKENSRLELQPVGQKEPNAFGLYDMLGNVAEWTSTAPASPNTFRIFRGGSFESGRYGNSKAFVDVNAKSGIGIDSSHALSDIGFRLCGVRLSETEVRMAETKKESMVKAILAELIAIPGSVRDFKMGKYEVTQSQWEAMMGMNPSKFKDPNAPVENVSWNDCQKFLECLNATAAAREAGVKFRLPTRVEWRDAYSARSTESDPFKPYGGVVLSRGWIRDNSDGHTHPVGKKAPNALGLCDMIGNVAEWTADSEESRGTKLFHAVGGSWQLHNAWDFSYPKGYPPDTRASDLGLRLCASGRAD